MAFGIFCGHLVHCVVIWYILWSFDVFSAFGLLYQEKSGNPEIIAPDQSSFQGLWWAR
jgi:hypothetical protein